MRISDRVKEKIKALLKHLDAETETLRECERDIRRAAGRHHSEEMVGDISPSCPISPFSDNLGWVQNAIRDAKNQRTVVYGTQQKILVLQEVLAEMEADEIEKEGLT